MDKYKLFQSEVINSDPQTFINNCLIAHNLFESKYNKEKGSTRSYTDYNLFVLTAGSLSFYKLYKELCQVIRSYVNNNDPIWIEAWINFHDQNEILDWHNHHWDFHGYISVDPKQSITEFEQWQIENKQGQIYIGEGYHFHRVVAKEPFEGKRITIGFDCTTNQDNIYLDNHLIPVL